MFYKKSYFNTLAYVKLWCKTTLLQSFRYIGLKVINVFGKLPWTDKQQHFPLICLNFCVTLSFMKVFLS